MNGRFLRRPGLIALIALCVALLLPTRAAAQSQNDVLRVPPGTTATGSVSTVAQDIVIEGVVPGDVTTWSGDITIRGHVQGDVVSYAGRVTIEGGAVDGNVMAPGGIARTSGATIGKQALGGQDGNRALASVFDVFAPTRGQPTTPSSAVGRVLFGVLLGIFVLAFTLLWAALWPRRTRNAMRTLQALPGRALALGLLTTLLLAVLLPLVGALLTATLIGLPVLITLLVVLQAPYVYGLAALTQALGQARREPRVASTATGLAAQPPQLAAGLNPRAIGAAATVALAVAIVTAVQPLAGLALFYLAASPGLGAAVLSRGGLAVAE